MGQINVEHRFLNVQDEAKVSTLRHILSATSDPTLVFVNTADKVMDVASRLQAAGVNVAPLCRLVPPQERLHCLEEFGKTDGGLDVVVCTDMASRGLDTTLVKHVVQLDFARSAVDFIHRSGRTGRQGRRGTVTSLVSEGEVALASAMEKAVNEGSRLDGSFSRKRSFRKRVRKGRM